LTATDKAAVMNRQLARDYRRNVVD
jgi:hypothetical protein